MRRAIMIGALATAAAAVTACGSAKAPAAAAPVSMGQPREVIAARPDHETVAGAGSADLTTDQRGQIEKLSKEVEEEVAKMGFTPPAPIEAAGPAERMSKIPLSTDETCKPVKTERCESSCKISDSICTNASKICELAVQLDDSWSANKCATAKKSCDTAHENCCNCKG